MPSSRSSPPGGHAQATDLIPGAVLVELPGSPHNAVYVTAEALVAEVLRFLSQLAPESRGAAGTALPRDDSGARTAHEPRLATQ